MAGVGIQQLSLHRLAQQRLVGMLAVNVDEQGAELGAILQGGRAAIDIGPAAALGGDNSAQQALFAGVQVSFLQPGLRLGDGADI